MRFSHAASGVGALLLAAAAFGPSPATLGRFKPESPQSQPVITWEYDQIHAELAYGSASGRYLAVWEDHHWGWGADWDIYGRWLSGAAVGQGDAFGIAWADSRHRLAPDVAYNSVDNQFLVVWELEYSTSDHDIYARRVFPDGTLGTSELPVATETTYDGNPAVAYDAVMDQYLVVWERMNALGRHDIYGRRLRADGTPNGDAFLIYAPGPTTDAPTTPYDAVAPAVAFSPIRMSFIVVWQDKFPPATTYDIRAQMLGETGFLIGDDFAVCAWDYDQLNPRVALNSRSDEFLIVWEDHHWAWGADSDIYGQRVRADGVPMGGNFGIGWDGTGRRLAPDVAYDAASGDYMVAWEYEFSTTDHDIYQRTVRADGSLPGLEVAVSAPAADQTRPVIAAGGGRSFALVWQDARDAGKGLNLYADPAYIGQPTLDLLISHIEVTQAIQCKGNARCADNAVPLVAGKRTYARVYVQVAGTAAGNIANVTASATAREWNGTTVQGTLLNGPIVAMTAPDRAKDDDTLNFVFDGAALNQIGVLEVTVNPGHTIPEDDFANNTRAVALNYQAVPDLHIVAVRLAIQKYGQWRLVSVTMPSFIGPYTRNALPIGKLVWHFLPAPVFWPDPVATDADWDKLLNALRDMKKKDTSMPAQAHWYGMLPFTFVDGPSGLGSMPGYEAIGRVPLTHEDLEDGADIMIHELGHNWNRPHAPCGVGDPDPSYPYANAQIGDVGWDPNHARGGKFANQTPGYAVPAGTADFMSYCQDEWVSEYTYRAILNYRGSWPVGEVEPAQIQAPQQPDELRPYLFASGTLSGSIVALNPFAILTRTAGFSDQPGAGPYRLRVVAGNGDTLFERRFAPSFDKPTWLTDTLLMPTALAGWFYEIVPWYPNAAKVQIWGETAKLAERGLSANAPTVAVIAPQAGDVWSPSGAYTIRWAGGDADGGSVYYDVAFSRDNGTNWQMLASRLQVNSLDVTAELFGGTSQARVRVFASDGLRTSEATSGAFRIERKPPVAVIAAPGSGAGFAQGRPVLLSGSAYDAEDGALAGDRLTWTSNRDGALGSGESRQVTLSPGMHAITLQATDSDGAVGTATIYLSMGYRTLLPLVRR